MVSEVADAATDSARTAPDNRSRQGDDACIGEGNAEEEGCLCSVSFVCIL